MTTKQEQARALYFQKDMTQAEIAQLLQVNAKTVYRWMKQGHWERIKKASLHAPAVATEKLYFSLNKICDSINNRPQNMGIPSLDEARVLLAIASTIKKVGNRPSLVDHCESIGSFMDFVVRKDIEKGQLIAREMDEYLYKEADMSAAYYDAYELPYHADQLQHIEEDMADEFEDGSSIASTIPPQPVRYDDDSTAYTKEEWREKKLRERNEGVRADYHKNKTAPPVPQTSDELTAEENTPQEIKTTTVEPSKAQEEKRPLLSPGIALDIRRHVTGLFPNGRWVPAGASMVRDICTNLQRRLTAHEISAVLAKGYTLEELESALE